MHTVTRFSIVLLGICLILGCLSTRHEIVAHITLDIRHVRDHAANAIDYIEGKTDTPPDAAIPSAASAENKTSLLEGVLKPFSFVQVAHAQQMDADTTRGRELLNSMRDRFPKVLAAKDKGYIGEDNKGYIALRDHGDLSADNALKQEIQQLLTEENNDRRAYYREVVRANQGLTLSKIEQAWAAEYRKRARQGHYVQMPDAGEQLEEFKKTELGRKLGDEARPGVWVQVP